MQKSQWFVIILLLLGCRIDSPVQTSPTTYLYAYRSVLFSQPTEQMPSGNWKWVDTQIALCVNGTFLNVSTTSYAAFPRLKVIDKKTDRLLRYFDGGLGYTATEDWSQYVPHEDRWQPLTVKKDTVRANQQLRIKVLTGLFYVPDTIVTELVFVINGVEQDYKKPFLWKKGKQ